mmetsp:Transcript_116654/g.329963  ORF Transcript_116654/g.329963 Transcript_116654/m.329963 type:complete len:128 (+) Transcript_116654:126-509(+)
MSTDRQSRMLTSSVRAPAKKGGMGGGYTWGGAMDVQDYVPVGTRGHTNVSTAPAETAQEDVLHRESMGTLGVSISNEQQFPALGSKPAAQAKKKAGAVAGVNGGAEATKASEPRRSGLKCFSWCSAK